MRIEMDNDLTSLSDLFNRSIYRIPDYQRGYAWEEKEVRDFWDDLEILSESRLHYGGVITLEKVGEDVHKYWSQDTWLFEKRNIQAYYVVDGQQRLTTAMVLLSVILDNMKNKYSDKQLDENMSVNEIEKAYILETNNNSLNFTFLFSYEKDNDSYEYYIANILKKGEAIDESEIKRNKYTDNLQFAYDFFYKKCESLSFEELDALYCKLVYKFVFNRYVISSKLDIFVTFETMNNRGKNLSQLELLKNRLIYLTTLYEVDSGTKKEMRNKINKCWKELYNYLGKLSPEKIGMKPRRFVYLEGNPLVVDDIFLQAQVSSYPSEDFKKFIINGNEQINELEEKQSDKSIRISISDLLKLVFTAKNAIEESLLLKDIDTYISDLSMSIKFWSGMKSPDLSDYSKEMKEYLYKINYLINSNRFNYYHYYVVDNKGSQYRSRVSFDSIIESIIFKMLKSNYVDEVLKVLKTMEKILFMNAFFPEESLSKAYEAQRTVITKELFDLIFEFDGAYFYDSREIEEFNRKLTKIRNEFAKTVTLIGDDYKNKSAYYQYKNIAYYILLEYEIFLMKKSKNNFSIAEISAFYENRDDYSLEHIYPKNGRNKYWNDQFGHLTSKEKDQYKNTLGNLIVISKAKNDGLGNKDYLTKVDSGSINNPMGYTYGGYAERYLVKNYKEWSVTSIEKRGKEVLDFLQKNWGLRIPKQKTKDFLGLPKYSEDTEA